jgi:translation initiation factor IF-2
VSGSLEALKYLLSTQEIVSKKVELIFSGVGPVTESDIMLATTTNGKYSQYL